MKGGMARMKTSGVGKEAENAVTAELLADDPTEGRLAVLEREAKIGAPE
jgi:hypothetical protein